MDYPLSDTDIYKIFEDKCRVVRYADVHKYKTLDELLGPYKCVILLYEWKNRYGHYAALFERSPNTLEFFDSYGTKPDHQLKKIKENFKKENFSDKAYLSMLILKKEYDKIIYNEHKFQKKDPNIKTCGRWCVLRLLFRNITLKEFKHFFYDEPKIHGILPDYYVTLLTHELF